MPDSLVKSTVAVLVTSYGADVEERRVAATSPCSFPCHSRSGDRNGRGIPQDYVEAHKWRNLAGHCHVDVALLGPFPISARIGHHALC